MSEGIGKDMPCKECGQPRYRTPSGKWICRPCHNIAQQERRRVRLEEYQKRDREQKRRAYWSDPETSRAKGRDWERQRYQKRKKRNGDTEDE